MKSFQYKGKQYTTGIHESYGWAYPCVYEERSLLFFKWKERVYTQDGVLWPYHVAVNSRPDQIEYHSTQVDKRGNIKGGTATAWNLAKAHDVPYFNLYNEEDKQRLIKFVES